MRVLRSSVAKMADAMPKTINALGMSYSAASLSPSGPKTASRKGYAKVPKLTPVAHPTSKPRS